MKIVVNVTDEHIAKGKRYNSINCPLALATRVALERNTCIGMESCTVYGLGVGYFPTSITKWIKEFDLGLKVDPIQFELEIVSFKDAKN